MITIASIVEGHGEVAAVPVLLRRIAARVSPELVVDVLSPFRIQRQRFTKPGEVERGVEFVARRSGNEGRILILLDANSDCPRDAAHRILERAHESRGDRRVRVVLAQMEYEAWFLATATSVAGRRGIRSDIAPPTNPEGIRDAKGWISARMVPGRSYSPSTDQPALTAVFDLDAARSRAPSFDKLYRDVESLLLDG